MFSINFFWKENIILHTTNNIASIKTYKPFLRSLHNWTQDINKNEVLSWKNLTTKRPGTGDFLSHKIYSLIGRKAKKYIKKNHLIKKKYIK